MVRSRSALPTTKQGVLSAAALGLAVIVFLASAPGADTREDSPDNLPPAVQFTTEPLDGARVPARLQVSWTGTDSDGAVDHYEYAVDSNAWTAVPDTFAEFVFATPEADSILIGSERVPASTFHGSHALQVRAVDDEGAISEPATASFMAYTVTPRTTITKPAIGTGILDVGSSIRVAWEGVDPDGPPTEPLPVGYLYKLLQTNTIPPGIPLQYLTDPKILYDYGDEWIYQSADSLQGVFSLTVPAQYFLGVRAVDESGAVEPFLEFGRNVLKFQTSPTSGTPKLVLSEPVLGSWSCTVLDTNETTVPEFRTQHFVVSCDATAQGETCPDMRWALDIADPAQSVGWSEWQPVGALPPLTLYDAAPHRFFVQVRDSYGTATTMLLQINVVEFPFDREVLWVDDYRDTSYPNDNEHDAFWASLFRDSGRFDGDWTTGTQVFRHEVFGPSDTSAPVLNPPSLSELARYRLVIWETFGNGYNGYSGLLASASASRDLAVYLAAGGKLWVDGALTVPPLLPPPTPTGPADFVYPKNVSPGTFAWDFMKLASSRIMNAKGVPVNDNLVGVLAFPGKPATYPAMQQDSNKVSPFKVSVSHCDAVFDPILAQNIPGFRGVIDSLYVYQAKVTTSTYHNRLVALRWHDPSPTPLHGRVQWFGFPLYYMKKAQAQDTFNRSIDWFREAEAVIPVTLVYFTGERLDEEVVLKWRVGDVSDHAGFHVFREQLDDKREQLTDDMLRGTETYEFRDVAPPMGTADYWLAEYSRSGTVTWSGPVHVEAASPTRRVTLTSPLPNPFAAEMRVFFSTSAFGNVRLSVMDVRGRLVTDLVDGERPAGRQSTTWDGRDAAGQFVPAGLYFLRLKAEGVVAVQRVIFLR